MEALAERQDATSEKAIRVRELSSATHVIVGPTGQEDVVLRDSTKAATLRLTGSRAAIGPITAILLLDATAQARRALSAVAQVTDLLFRPRRTKNRSRERVLLRDALIVLDARCANASLRDAARLIYGTRFVRREWSGDGGWLKERMRRARTKGEMLRDGGYRKLLQQVCCCDA